MILKKSNKGFTLIEILVVIIIIAIITIGVSGLYSNNSGNIQKLAIEVNKIQSVIDTVRNYSLVGKGVGKDLITPKYYLVKINVGANNSITTFYNTGSVISGLSKLNELSLNNINIKNITCINKFNRSDTNTINSIDLIFKGEDLSSSGCLNKSQRLIDLEVRYKDLIKKIRINTINGIVEHIK